MKINHNEITNSFLFKMIKFDILSQIKQGFYLVYAIITIIYILILFYIPTSFRTEVTAYLILSDTSVMGLVFVGALVLLEKQQNLLQSLFITPLRLSDYILSKSLSLTIIAVLVSAVIGFIPGGMINNIIPFIISVVLCSMFYTLLGLGISAQVSSVNQYFIGIIAWSLITSIPLVLFFIIPDYSIIFPVNAAIDLLVTPSDVQTVRGIIADSSVLLCWCILAYIYACRQFKKYVVNK